MYENWQECLHQLQVYLDCIDEMLFKLHIASLCIDRSERHIEEMAQVWEDFWKEW